MRYSHKMLVASKVNFFVGVVELMLALRVVLRFFNGNPDASFIHWVYANTNVLLEPLRGIFISYNVLNSGWVIDFVALAAMALYATVGYMLVSFMANWGWMKRK